MKKFLLFLSTFFLLVILCALIINPSRYFEVCKQGLLVWAFTLLPALIPFFFCTLLLSKITNVQKIAKLFDPICKFFYNHNGIAGYVQLMSFISGYPVGARLICEFANQGIINEREATKLSTFCSTSGPAFIVASISAITLKNTSFGFLLLFSHYLSAILNGIIFRKYCVYRPIAPLLKKAEGENILYETAFSTFNSCLLVGVLVSFFFVVSALFCDLYLTYPIQKLFAILFLDEKKAAAFTTGLLECTKGCLLLSESDGLLRLPLICALISFGGFSVIFQSLAFLKQAKANGKIFLLSKVIQTITSFFASLLLCLVFKIS